MLPPLVRGCPWAGSLLIGELRQLAEGTRQLSVLVSTRSFCPPTAAAILQATPAAWNVAPACVVQTGFAAQHQLRRAGSSAASGAATLRASQQAQQPRAGPAAAAGGGARPSAGWVLLLPSAFAAGLGVWQLQRRTGKIDLLQQRTAALQAEPVDVFGCPSTPPEYTRVTASGAFRNERSLAVGPRPRSVMGGTRPGAVLVTPLHSQEWQRDVLVARGWVPQEWWSDAKLRTGGSPAGPVTVSGVVRHSERRSGFVPDNDAASGQWYWIDVPALAASAGLPADTPLVEVMSERAGEVQHGTVPTSMDLLALRTSAQQPQEHYPLPKSMEDLLNFSVMPDDHRNYAATWFTLAGLTAALALRAVRQNSRIRRRTAG